MASDIVSWIVALAVAYLVGSIPSAYIAGRLRKGKDIRQEGDKNPGAENAYRTIGAKVGLAVGAVDVGKGAVAILVAKWLPGGTGVELAAGAAVIAGHNWPIFLQLRGGRGAASAVGVFMALIPIPAVPLSVASLMLLPFTKSATVTIGLIMIPMPFLAWWITDASYYVVAYTVGLPILIGVRHHLTSRKLPRRQTDLVEREALPKG